MFWLDIKIRYDMRISWNVGVVYYDWTTNMDEQISYNRWNILQISILRFRTFFWCYWDTSIFQKQYTGPNKGDVFVRFRHWNGAKLGRFCSQPVFHPSHPPGPSGWPEVVFHPQSHRILLSVPEHTYDFGSLASSSLDLKWGEVGKCQLEKRWDPESTRKLHITGTCQKKNTTATVEEIPKMAMLRFSVFQDVSGFQPLVSRGDFSLGDGFLPPKSRWKDSRDESVKQLVGLVGSNIMKVPC